MTDPRSRHAVRMSERFADGLADPDELQAAAGEAGQGRGHLCTPQAAAWAAAESGKEVQAAVRASLAAASAAALTIALRAERVNGRTRGIPARLLAVSDAVYQKAWREHRAGQCGLLRDIFGNPFRPPAPLPPCTSRDGERVQIIARTIAEERCFADLPALADALAETGWDRPDLQAHFRAPGCHTRGCWALDVVLGKR
jgi:hypothetical protein